MTLTVAVEGRREMHAEGYYVVAVIPFETLDNVITIKVNAFDHFC